jgi:hypothetical protein
MASLATVFDIKILLQHLQIKILKLLSFFRRFTLLGANLSDFNTTLFCILHYFWPITDLPFIQPIFPTIIHVPTTAQSKPVNLTKGPL